VGLSSICNCIIWMYGWTEKKGIAFPSKEQLKIHMNKKKLSKEKANADT